MTCVPHSTQVTSIIATASERTLSAHVHRIVKFVTAAIHRHGMILTESNRHHCEQWVELVARLFLYDSSDSERQSTCKLIRRHHNQVMCNIEAVLNFEKLIRNTGTSKHSSCTEQCAHETELRNDWEQFSAELTSATRRRKRDSACVVIH
jgi:hypothetical protein